MILRWREFGGRPGSRLFERLHGSIERYRDRSEYINIGLTTDPTLLWSEQRHAGWSEMVVIYSTSTRDFAAAVEVDLLARGWGAYVRQLGLRTHRRAASGKLYQVLCLCEDGMRQANLAQGDQFQEKPDSPLDAPENPVYNPYLQKSRRSSAARYENYLKAERELGEPERRFGVTQPPFSLHLKS